MGKNRGKKSELRILEENDVVNAFNGTPSTVLSIHQRYAKPYGLQKNWRTKERNTPSFSPTPLGCFPMSLLSRLRFHIHILILCLCWYTISSVGSQVTKQILTECPLPLFLGEFQFVFTALLAALCSKLAKNSSFLYNLFPENTFPDFRRFRKTPAVTPPSRHLILTVLPLSLFQFVGKYFGHKATSMVPVSTVSSIKTLSPIFILIFQKLFRIHTLPVTVTLCFSLSTLLSGVWIIVKEDNRYRTISETSLGNVSSHAASGITFATISMIIFVLQNIYGKNVFTFKLKSDSRTQLAPQTRVRLPVSANGSGLPIFQEIKPNSEEESVRPTKKSYDKLTLMIYISSLGFLMSLGWFTYFELPIVLDYFIHGRKSGLVEHISWPLFFTNGVLHFAQAMITFHLLGEVSTLTYSIANLMKRIAVISASWVFSRRSISPFQILGLLLNTLGLYLYERCSFQDKVKKARLE